MRRCTYCMRETDDGNICRYCGGDENKPYNPRHLPPNTAIGDRYIVGRALNQTGDAIIYAALDQQTNARIRIYEYFPRKCARRDSGALAVLPVPGSEQEYADGMEVLRSRMESLGCQLYEGNGSIYAPVDKRQAAMLRGGGAGAYAAGNAVDEPPRRDAPEAPEESAPQEELPPDDEFTQEELEEEEEYEDALARRNNRITMAIVGVGCVLLLALGVWMLTRDSVDQREDVLPTLLPQPSLIATEQPAAAPTSTAAAELPTPDPSTGFRPLATADPSWLEDDSVIENGDDYAPVARPTRRPTNPPAPLPTAVATVIPTEAPTAIPTVIPTAVATAIPTEAPTAIPTAVPTVIPTEVPTEVPTIIPTEAPTEVPTIIPTEAPTEAPTEVPTEAPTEVPTIIPTEVPTEAPTEVPTEAPTEVPTIIPTEVPTEAPTEVATEEPASESSPYNGSDFVPAANSKFILSDKREIWTMLLDDGRTVMVRTYSAPDGNDTTYYYTATEDGLYRTREYGSAEEPELVIGNQPKVGDPAYGGRATVQAIMEEGVLLDNGEMIITGMGVLPGDTVVTNEAQNLREEELALLRSELNPQSEAPESEGGTDVPNEDEAANAENGEDEDAAVG